MTFIEAFEKWQRELEKTTKLCAVVGEELKELSKANDQLTAVHTGLSNLAQSLRLEGQGNQRPESLGNKLNGGEPWKTQ